CLQDDATIGQTYELAGPGVWTLRQLVQAAGRWSGVRGGRGRPVIGLPPALGRLQAAALELLPGPPLMSRDNLDSLRVDNVASGALPGLQALGIQPAPLPPIAMRFLGEASEQALLDGYRRTAGR
ncbi:MAG TPA: complex I NDUFA9 subunit family protein, partial [Ottowia sp.]|nr:complex I NDUFA9 subunit family protein [Ottowia sp.]